MSEFNNFEIKKAPSDSDIEKKEEFIMPKFYKYESKYGNPDQIEKEDEEVLLSNFQKELKEMQEEIKNKKSSDDLYAKEKDISKLKPDLLTSEEAKLWEYFKLAGSVEEIEKFEKDVFSPYRERITEKLFNDIKLRIKGILQNPSENDKLLIEKIKKSFKKIKEWGTPAMQKISEEEYIENQLKNDFRQNHPRVLFGEDLMGNYLNVKGGILRRNKL